MFFQRPILGGLFLEGLIFEGAYIWREICFSKSIGLALQFEGNLPLLLCFTLYLRAISKYKPARGGLHLEGRFNGGFLRYEFGGFIFGGAYHQEFYGIYETFHAPLQSFVWRRHIGAPFWRTNMAAGNQQKHLEFTFSVKVISFNFTRELAYVSINISSNT